MGKEIANIVDGYMGIVYDPSRSKYETLKAIQSDIPPSDKELVESHLHWIKGYDELCGADFHAPNRAFWNEMENTNIFFKFSFLIAGVFCIQMIGVYLNIDPHILIAWQNELQEKFWPNG